MKLLIVDDEEDVRNGIRTMIDWEGNGIEVVGEAEDGLQALQAARYWKPDILLMDIRMPEMNGLQVAETLKAEGHEAKSVLLSGYDDFSFARQALKFGVSEYLLKPCLPEDILGAVLKLKTEIRREREHRDLHASIQAMFDAQLPYLKERFLLKCLRGELTAAENIEDGFASYRIAIPPRQACAAIVTIDEYGSFSDRVADGDLAYLQLAVRSAAEASVGSRRPLELVVDQEDLVLVGHLGSATEEAEWLDGLAAMQEELRARFGFTVSVGVGEACEDMRSLHRSYSEATQALEARFALGAGCLIRYRELAESSPAATHYPLSEEKQLVQAVRHGNFDALDKQTDAFFAALHPASREHVSRCCTALLLSLYHLVLEKRSNPDDLFPRGLASVGDLLNVPTLRQMKDNVLKTASGVSRKINGRKPGHKTIEQAVAYIRLHYAGELSLETVASRVFVNPNYFCLLFKQETGIGFIDYVHKVRIEKACEHLDGRKYKAYEIAAMVGYANEKYFGQIFKKLTGMTPSQYRERVE